MVNMPDCLFNGFGDSNGKFVSKTETWEISEANWIISWLEGWPINDSSISLMGYGPIYYVAIGVGDPDNGENIIFEKKQ
ncbi:MAG: hypothetical protein LLG40_02695 [Deltaproteobacteria bacterium]|nr:hypothetical protein [Deltaproteobacteria bacterium]